MHTFILSIVACMVSDCLEGRKVNKFMFTNNSHCKPAYWVKSYRAALCGHHDKSKYGGNLMICRYKLNDINQGADLYFDLQKESVQ